MSESDGEISAQHYAFFTGEDDFDRIFVRILDRKLLYWADPAGQRPNENNRLEGGRRGYFEDPDEHFWEILTRLYGG